MVRKMSKRATEEALAAAPEAVREAAMAGGEMTQAQERKVASTLRRDQISRAGRQMEAAAEASGDPFLRAVAAWMKAGLISANAMVMHGGGTEIMAGGEFDHLGRVARGYLAKYGDGS